MPNKNINNINKKYNTTPIKKYQSKNKNNNQYTFISARVPMPIKDYIYKLSQLHNESKSQILRDLIHKNMNHTHTYIKLNKKQDDRIHSLLNGNDTLLNKIYNNVFRIGGNLNQIARTLNKKKNEIPTHKQLLNLFSNVNEYEHDEENLRKISNSNHMFIKLIIRREMNYLDSKENRNE